MILSCAGCGKSLKVADEHAGRRAKCPVCGTIVNVPRAAPVSAAKTDEAPRQHAEAPQDNPGRAAAPSQRPLPMSAPATNDVAPGLNGQTYDAQQTLGAEFGRAAAAPPTDFSPFPSPHEQRPGANLPHECQTYSSGAYAPPSPPGTAYPQQRSAAHYRRPGNDKDPALAAVFEILGGLMMQTFGIGHIYAGNVAVGLTFMFGYWLLCFVNIILMFALIGILTYPLCWLLFLIVSPITAASSIKRY